jgi:hypothetical protein
VLKFSLDERDCCTLKPDTKPCTNGFKRPDGDAADGIEVGLDD